VAYLFKHLSGETNKSNSANSYHTSIFLEFLSCNNQYRSFIISCLHMFSYMLKLTVHSTSKQNSYLVSWQSSEVWSCKMIHLSNGRMQICISRSFIICTLHQILLIVIKVISTHTGGEKCIQNFNQKT
jgi:hypothetical protein